MTYCYFASDDGQVRKHVSVQPDMTEISSFYITSFDSDDEDIYCGQEMLLYPDKEDSEIFWVDGTIGNVSADQDDVVFQGTLGQCMRYIRQMENEA